VVVSTPRYTLRGDDTWLAVQRIRLCEDDVPDAVEAARSFMRVTGASHASWWLSENSTPADLESRLLADGLKVVPDDYLIDGMLLTAPPPPGPADVDARAVADEEEYAAAVEAQYAAFATPADRRRDRATLRDEFALTLQNDVRVMYATWIGDRLVGAGRASFSSRGAFLNGGSTLPAARGRGAYRALVRARWDDATARGTPALAVQAGAMSAPILHRLGFEQVCRFRRLEDVLDGA